MFGLFGKSLNSEEERSKAYLLFTEWGPRAQVDRFARLTKKFPRTPPETLHQWIKDFELVDARVWSCAEKGGAKALTAGDFEAMMKKEFPWMCKNALTKAWGLVSYYVYHEGFG